MSLKLLLAGISLLSVLTLTGCDNNKPADTTNVNKTADVSHVSKTTDTSAETNNPTLSVKHAQGTTAVPVNPAKVIVFNTATLDTMDALGIKIAGLPKSSTHLPKFLQQYESDEYFNAGTLFEPNYEALSNLKPDLIIAGGRTADAYDKLSEIAPTIALNVDPKDFVNSLAERTEQLGQIFNKQAEAEKLITDFKQQITSLREKTANQGTAMMIMINGGKISSYGPGSRFGFIFDQLGFTPATEFPQAGTHGNVMNAELLLAANPDWLFVLDRDSAIGNDKAQSAQQVLDNPLVQRSKAWTNNHIVYLDSSALYIAGGVQTYSQMMDQINQILDAGSK